MNTVNILISEINSLAVKMEESDDLIEKERYLSMIDRNYFLYNQMKNDTNFGGSDNVPNQ